MKPVDLKSLQYVLGYSDEDLDSAVLLGLPVKKGKVDLRDAVAWHIRNLTDSQRREDSNLALTTLRNISQFSESAIAQVNAAKILLETSRKEAQAEIKDTEIIAFIDIRNIEGIIEATEIFAECPQCGQTITKKK